MWRRTLVVAMAAAVSLAVAAISLGAIPGSSETISGCYAKSNGSLRVIDAESGASCVSNKETALSWNQQGPQGLPGPQGPAGASTRDAGTNREFERRRKLGQRLRFQVRSCVLSKRVGRYRRWLPHRCFTSSGGAGYGHPGWTTCKRLPSGLNARLGCICDRSRGRRILGAGR